MHIEINAAQGVERSEALDQHIREKLETVNRHCGDRLTRVIVHCKDVNADKGGADKQCAMEARPAGLDAVGVDATDVDLYIAVNNAASKLEKAVQHRAGRAKS